MHVWGMYVVHKETLWEHRVKAFANGGLVIEGDTQGGLVIIGDT